MLAKNYFSLSNFIIQSAMLSFEWELFLQNKDSLLNTKPLSVVFKKSSRKYYSLKFYITVISKYDISHNPYQSNILVLKLT